MLGNIDRENTMKRLDSSSALITVDGAESAVSWRLRLMQLRALNAGAGNASGMLSAFYNVVFVYDLVWNATDCRDLSIESVVAAAFVRIAL